MQSNPCRIMLQLAACMVSWTVDVQTYLDTYLATLREEGYSIFVILGQLPAPSSSADSGNGSGAWYTPQQVGWPAAALSQDEM